MTLVHKAVGHSTDSMEFFTEGTGILVMEGRAITTMLLAWIKELYEASADCTASSLISNVNNALLNKWK